MAGTTYHASKAWKSQDFLVGDLLCTIVFVPGGTISVVSKCNSTCRAVCANSDIFCRHGYIRLRVILHCGINQHQFEIFNTLWIMVMPEMSDFSMFVLPVQLHFVSEWRVAQIVIFVLLVSMNV